MIVNFSLRLFLVVIIITGVSLGAIPDPVFRNVRDKFIWGNESLSEVSGRIHGGYNAEEGQFKFMVFLLIVFNQNVFPPLSCSGSVITKHWVLTAAHCVVRPRSSVIAVAGKADLRAYIKKRLSIPFHEDIEENSFGVQERRVFRVFVHPKYSTSDNSNDFALLHLERPFISGPDIRPSVETLSISEKETKSPRYCTVVGWGLNEQDKQTFKLMYASDVKANPPRLCYYVKSEMFLCLERGGPGICKGDSGSPLVCNDEIWGVASFAMSHHQNPSCLDQEEEYYAKIYEVLPWINSTLNDSSGSLNIRAVIGVSGYLGLSLLWLFR